MPEVWIVEECRDCAWRRCGRCLRVLDMAIARASRLARAAGKQVTVTGRPVRLIRPVRMKPEEPPLPVKAPQGQGIWDTPNIKAAVGMALAIVLAKLTMMVCFPRISTFFVIDSSLGNRNMYRLVNGACLYEHLLCVGLLTYDSCQH